MSTPNRARLSTERETDARKTTRCPGCSRTNPPDAFYCHFDGKPLFKELQATPLAVGNLLFPTPFCFSNGQACTNFNQLALACNNLWNESKMLLSEGIWAMFFAAMGRVDLATAAKLAAKEPDPDRGLCLLLEKFPADAEFLRAPKLALLTSEVNLGQLAPGRDYTFDLTIKNQGMLLLHGIVASSFDWLIFGDPVELPPSEQGPPAVRPLEEHFAQGGHHYTSEKRFQTRLNCTIPVVVMGQRLRAGLKPVRGEIILDTNGGALTLPVQAEVPIREFPRGAYANDVLAGVKSPRELAVKAKAYPKEAGMLFEQGAVKAWYESNGWTYPIEGSDGMGAGAVQQFFEALGLTKPPRLEIDTSFLMLRGRIGELLSTRVTVRTQDAKPVYAQAWSNQEWVKPGPIKYMGSKVQIPFEILVPSNSGDTAQAQVLIQGNGKQRFVVPVTVAVRRG